MTEHVLSTAVYAVCPARPGPARLALGGRRVTGGRRPRRDGTAVGPVRRDRSASAVARPLVNALLTPLIHVIYDVIRYRQSRPIMRSARLARLYQKRGDISDTPFRTVGTVVSDVGCRWRLRDNAPVRLKLTGNDQPTDAARSVLSRLARLVNPHLILQAVRRPSGLVTTVLARWLLLL